MEKIFEYLWLILKAIFYTIATFSLMSVVWFAILVVIICLTLI